MDESLARRLGAEFLGTFVLVFVGCGTAILNAGNKGINLLGVAIYCADSRAGQLMLIDGSTGQESDGHDWNNLLGRWGLLQHDTVIARWMRAIAWLVCVGGIIIAVWSALQLRQRETAAS